MQKKENPLMNNFLDELVINHKHVYLFYIKKIVTKGNYKVDNIRYYKRKWYLKTNLSFIEYV